MGGGLSVSLSLSPKYVCSPLSAKFLLTLYVQAFMPDCLSLGAVWVRQCSYVLAVSDSLPVSVGLCLCQSAGFPKSLPGLCSCFSLVSADFILAYQSVVPQIGFSHPRGLITL